MTENKARIVEEPAGYDYPPTDRIPAQGDVADGQTTVDRPEPSDGAADGQPRHATLAADEAYSATLPDAGAVTLPADDLREDIRDENRAENRDDYRADDRDDYRDDYRDGTYAGTQGGVAAMPEPEPVDRIERDEPVAEPAGNHAAGSVETPGGEGFFPQDTVTGFRDRWRELQSGFVDDPQQAVRGADELVSEIMRELAERKQSIEDHWRDGANDTEELRVAIQEYRSFLNQLLNA